MLSFEDFSQSLVQDGHLKKFIDQERTRADEVEVKPNTRFDRGNEEIEDAMERHLPLETSHMVGGPYHPDLVNKIRGKIHIVHQMHEVLVV